MLEFLNTLDHSWTLAINSLGADGSLDAVARLFSKIQIWFPLYIAVAITFFARLGWKKGLIALGAMFLCVVLCDQGANLFKDHVFMRLRPCFDEAMLAGGLHVIDHYPGGYFYGFFSGHAANCFGFATLSSLISTQDKKQGGAWKAYRIAIHVWAFCVALSRIICGKHFLGDVTVGALFGIGVAYLLFLCFKSLSARIEK